MEDSSSDRRSSPLSQVVSDCVRRWFQDTLKEAKAGDLSMQVLVAQMYYTGYGVPIDAHKVNSIQFLSPKIPSSLSSSSIII